MRAMPVLFEKLSFETRSWLAAGILVLFQLTWFLPGYRLSADDVLFLGSAIQGWDKILEFSWKVAAEQGRIGGFLLVPINALGAYLQGFLIFRIGLILLDFGLMALIALWIARLSRQNISGGLFALMMGLYILGYSHLSPNAFPLQNLAPYLVLVAVRLPDDGNKYWLVARTLVAATAMSVSEYALLFGGAILAAEYLLKLSRDGLKPVFWSEKFWLDAASAVVPFVLYLAWRAYYPSGYVGNQITLDNPADFLKTWWGHAFKMYSSPRREVEAAFGNGRIVVEGLVFATVLLFALWRSDFKKLPCQLGYVLLLGGLAFAAYMTMPASLTAQQQNWCVNSHSCVFLDSRAAGYGVAVAIFGGMLALYRNRTTRILALIVIISYGFVVSLSNQRIALSMQAKADVWERANELACIDGDVTADLIDPNKEVSVHAKMPPEHHYMGREAFWRFYLDYAGANCSKP